MHQRVLSENIKRTFNAFLRDHFKTDYFKTTVLLLLVFNLRSLW